MVDNFFRKYNFPMVLSLSLLPLASIVGVPLYVYYYGIVWQEPVMFVIFWFLAGTGITIGYHRLFAHRSFKAHPVVQFIAMLCGSAALQNTILKWSSDHRIHHRKLDTEDDPYSIKKGFWHAHIGWIMFRNLTTESPLTNVNDLKIDPLLRWQHKWWAVIGILVGFFIRCLSQPYQSEDDKFKDPWNWTTFG